MVLAGRTVAVAAGTENHRGLFTLSAAVDGYAASFSTAGDNGLDNFPVLCRYFFTKGFQVSEAMLAEDLSDGSHNQLLSCAAVDVDKLAFAVDIRYLEKEALLQTQATGINGRKIGIIVEGSSVAENMLNFFMAED